MSFLFADQLAKNCAVQRWISRRSPNSGGPHIGSFSDNFSLKRLENRGITARILRYDITADEFSFSALGSIAPEKEQKKHPSKGMHNIKTC
ncbi:hypothetical protein [Synechocystis sp. CACIAM 05]|uniref:hypothetical protein n=1 Tax=Synechocystis sp. CACIAM 05 TaxID=1933929 RepID=UPI001F453703|nr:hypothetical protein [Synechocystis sp. CACIAM 05]